MASLTNPVNKQNIVDRFADYVVATGNSGISWGTNARPFAEFTSQFIGYEPLGGNTTGKSIEITGESISGTTITAATIYSTLMAETTRYTRLRFLRARLNVTSSGFSPYNTGTRPTPGVIYDQLAKANMSTGFQQTILGDWRPANFAAGSKITLDSLENLFNNLRTAYTVYQNVSANIIVNVCHASCHSSCHSSRIRR